MSKRTRTVVTIETRQRTLVRCRSQAATVCCPRCDDDTPLLTIEEAAMITKSTARDIYRRVEAGELHFSETEEGALLICAASLQMS